VEEAGQVLGVPPGTVKSRCSRGRARLAVTLGHLRNPQDEAAVLPGTTDQPTGTLPTTPRAGTAEGQAR